MHFFTNLSFQKVENILFYLLVLFLPTQLGKHFWPDFAFIDGIRIDYLSPTIYATDVIIISLFVIWLRRAKPTVNVRYVTFLLFLLVTISFSENPLNGLYSFGKFLEYSFVFIYVAKAIPFVVTMQKLASLLAVGTIGESLLALAQYVHQGSLGGLLYFFGERFFTASTPGIANASLNGELVLRAYGTFPHPNVLAGFLIVSMLLIFFYLYTARKGILRAVATLSLLLGTAALILTLSRIAIALWILFVGALFLVQLFKRKFTKQKKMIMLRWLFLSVALVLVFIHMLAPRFLETSLSEETVTDRQLLTQAAVQMVIERPVMGVGLGNFLSALDESNSPLSSRFLLQPVHNIVLLAFAEIGIVGGEVFVWFLGKSFAGLFKKSNAVSLLPIALCVSAIMLTGMADHYWLTLQQGQLLFAVILGLAWSKPLPVFNLGKGKNTRS
jgi:O-antigen ligase